MAAFELSRRSAEALQFADILVDRTARSVSRRGHEIHLGVTEFRLLEFLIDNAGRIVSRHEIATALWPSAPSRESRKIDVAVVRLRRALTRNRWRDPIRTVRGKGYMLEAEDVRPVQSAAQNARVGSLEQAIVGNARKADRPTVRVPSIELDHTARQVRRLGRELEMAPKPFAVLELLMGSPGRIFSREQIAKAVWGNANVDLRTVDAVVARVRRTINRGVLRDPIRAVRGQGYKFSEFFRETHSEWPPRRARKARLPSELNSDE